jgi:hypothetical protein
MLPARGDSLLEIDSMKKMLTASVALVTVFSALASTAFAAQSRHRAPVANDTLQSYARDAHEELLARPSDIVTAEGRIVGADPDLSIRAEILRDRSQGGF